MNANRPTLIKEVRRKQIIDTTIETIAANGFSNTTLGGIAKQAGVSTGVITYHFKNKDDLIEQSIRKLFEAPNAHVVSRVEGESTHRGRLRAYIEANIEFMRDHRSHSVALIYSFGSISSEEKRHRVMTRQHAKIRRYLSKILRAGQDAGEFGTFDSDTLSLILFAALEGLMLQWVLDEEAVDLARGTEELIAMAESRMLPGA